MSERSIEEGKRLLRAAAISRRKGLPVENSSAWSRCIQETVVRFPPFLRALGVILYKPLQGEVDTGLIRDDALKARKMVFYSNPDPSGSPELIMPDLAAAGCQPINDVEALLSSGEPGAVLIIVPGLLFDCRGNRLGRGGGWYDRLLSRIGVNAATAALAYEFQIIDEVPADDWDWPVDYIVTERRTIDCARTRSSFAS